MGGVTSSVGQMLLMITLAFFATEKLCCLHEAYQTQAHKIQDEAWLRAQCANATFYNNMRHHTTLCEEVEATARIGAAWHALAAVSGYLPLADAARAARSLSWQALAAAGLLCLLFLSAIVACLRSRPRDGLPYYYCQTPDPTGKHV